MSDAKYVGVVIVKERMIPPHRSRHGVVERATEFLRAHLSEPIRIAQICEAAGVSERSLRTAFHDVWGMSPTRYMRWSRLNDARRALLSAPNLPGTVTSIATEFGFFELGRFATMYKALFGERPSDTLRGANFARADSA